MKSKVAKLAVQIEELFNTRMTPAYNYGVQTSYTLHSFFSFLFLCSYYASNVIKNRFAFPGSFNFSVPKIGILMSKITYITSLNKTNTNYRLRFCKAIWIEVYITCHSNVSLHTVSSPPFFSMLAKRGGLAVFEYLGG